MRVSSCSGNVLGSCSSRKGGAGGGGQVHLKGENSIAMSGLGCRKACLVPHVFHFHVSVIEAGAGEVARWRV